MNIQNLNVIQSDRQRISRLYVELYQRHYRSGVVILKRENGAKTTLEVTEANISNCMIKHIEQVSVTEYGVDDGVSQIKTLYANMQNKDGSKLTPLGVEVMSEMILAAVSDAIDNNGPNVLEVGNA